MLCGDSQAIPGFPSFNLSAYMAGAKNIYPGQDCPLVDDLKNRLGDLRERRFRAFSFFRASRRLQRKKERPYV
jgi:hypothetical protein